MKNPNIFDILFINISNIGDDKSLPEKRAFTCIALTAVSAFYFMVLFSAIATLGIDVFSWIYKAWPWRTDNVRSWRHPGFSFVILSACTAGIFWWKVGRRCQAEIVQFKYDGVNFWLYVIWALFETIGALIIAIYLSLPWLALILQTAAFFGLAEWYRRHPVGVKQQENS